MAKVVLARPFFFAGTLYDAGVCDALPDVELLPEDGDKDPEVTYYPKGTVEFKEPEPEPAKKPAAKKAAPKKDE